METAIIVALITLALGLISNVITSLTSRKRNQHELNIKLIESLHEELGESRDRLQTKITNYETLREKYLELKSQKLSLEADVAALARKNEEILEKLKIAQEEISGLKEQVFQLTSEVQLLKARN